MDRRTDPAAKAVARAAYRAATGVRARIFARRARAGAEPRVFYGGARAGHSGGPLVKVQRLQDAFPEPAGTFNLVYSLSNAPYLGSDALAALKARGVGIVHNQNGVFYPGWYAGDWQAENARMGHAYRIADHVFWQSTFCRECADRFLGRRDGPGEVLFNAVDTRRFAPRRTEVDRGDRPFTFLLTGKIQAHLAYRLEDGVGGLSAARASGLDAELHVAGLLDAGARQALDAASRRHGVGSHVRFLGPYTQVEGPAVYAAADAYVMTKHADPCPNTVIEAMACGLPVAYVASGGVPELVGPDAGASIEADDDWERPFRPDTDALGAAMCTVADRRETMSAAARRRAEDKFDIGGWIARHKAVFGALLGDGR